MILTAVSRRLVWFLLVDKKDGQPYMGTTESFDSLEPTNVIDDFRDVVTATNSNKLAPVPASNLVINKNKASFEKRNTKRAEEVSLKSLPALG